MAPKFEGRRPEEDVPEVPVRGSEFVSGLLRDCEGALRTIKAKQGKITPGSEKEVEVMRVLSELKAMAESLERDPVSFG